MQNIIPAFESGTFFCNDAHHSLRQLFEDMSTMTEEEMDIFAAALNAESINGLDDILLIEQSLDVYTF